LFTLGGAGSVILFGKINKGERCAMDYLVERECGEDYILEGLRHFDLEAILCCGQAFRWNKTGEHTYSGIAFGLCRSVTQEGDTLIFHGVSEAEFKSVWFDYFDLARSYGDLKEEFSRHEHLGEAVAYCPGIRVLRQESWETLCTFILSQNNNITRIKSLAERLCAHFGQPISGGFDFPTPECLAALEPQDLEPVRCGFRAKYIIDAAQAVAYGRIDLEAIYTLPFDEALSTLQTIHGVGPKVAHCALLFGFGRTECLPVDVWMRRALDAWFPGGLPEEILPVAGIAQQYLFHYVRTTSVL